MSRTLKRPMFRGGGKVNSEGTGITSGLADRVPYKVGGTTLDPYVSGPLTPFPTSNELALSQKWFSAKPNSPVGRLFRDSELDDTTASEFLNFIEQTRPEIRKEGSGFSLSPISSAAASELPIVTDSSEKPEEKEPEEKEPEESSGANEPGGKGTVGLEDLDDITLDDFEQEITKKAELYEKLLAGEGSKKKSIFRALTAAAPGLLEEDYGGAIKAAGDVLGESDELGRKARLLAIQEKIEKDARKLPTKSQEVDILADRYVANGMNRADAYKAAEKKVYGSEKSELLAAYSPERELQDLTAAFAKSDDDLIAENPSGFAQAELYKREGVKVIPYENYYDAEKERSEYRPKINPADIEPGDVYFDPVSFKFSYTNQAGETGFTYNLNEAKTKASQ